MNQMWGPPSGRVLVDHGPEAETLVVGSVRRLGCLEPRGHAVAVRARQSVVHQRGPDPLALPLGRHADVAQVAQRLLRLVFPDPSPERGMVVGVIAEDLLLGARRRRRDRLVLLAGIGRDPYRDPRTVGGHPDPAPTCVLAVVVQRSAS